MIRGWRRQHAGGGMVIYPGRETPTFRDLVITRCGVHNDDNAYAVGGGIAIFASTPAGLQPTVLNPAR